MAPEALINQNMTVNEAMGTALKNYTKREALVYGDERITYGELEKRIETLAAGLQQLGIGKGDKIGVLLPNSPEYVVSLYALPRLGAVMVPINPQLKLREMEHILSDSGAVAVLTLDRVPGSQLADMLTDIRTRHPILKHLIVKGDQVPPGAMPMAELLELGTGRRVVETDVTRDDLFALVYTSGTTGLPKGTVHTHKNMILPVIGTLKLREAWMPKLSIESVKRTARLVRKYGSRIAKGVGRQQTMLMLTSSHGIAGLESMMQVFLLGEKLVMVPHFTPTEVLRLIEKERVTVLGSVPSLLAAIMRVSDLEKYDLSSLMVCGAGAAPMPPALAREIRERIGCAVIIGFGTTEVGGSVAAASLDDSDDLQSETVGRVLPGAELRIVDEQHREVPPGVVGELAVRSDAMMQGYHNAPELTARVLDDDGWYYTGDMATLDEKGYLRIVGRKMDMIIRGGQNIYPIEIEELLMAHPAVAEAAVIGVPSVIGGERVRAYVVTKDDNAISARELLDYLRGKLAPYKIPDDVRFVPDLPHSPAGKVQKFILQQSAAEEGRKPHSAAAASVNQ